MKFYNNYTFIIHLVFFILDLHLIIIEIDTHIAIAATGN